MLYRGKAMLLAGIGMLALATTAISQPETQTYAQSETQTYLPGIYAFETGSRSYLGVDIQDVTASRLEALKLKEEHGVEVTAVDQDAPAGKAGVKQHDVIVEFNGAPVESAEQLRRLIRETPPGRTVTLGISREGNPTKVSVQLADRGKTSIDTVPKLVLPRIPDIPKVDLSQYAVQFQTYSAVLGVQTENLTRQLGEYFGVKDGAGVLVRSVEKGSAAEKAGIKAGDVIVRAGDEKLTDRADLSHVLRSHREGGKLTLGIMRDRHEQTITIDLPRRGSGDSSFWPNSEELNHNWDNLRDRFEDYVDEVSPEVEHASELASRKALAAAQKALIEAQKAKPAADRALREAEQQMRRAQRELERQNRQLKSLFDTMI